MLERFNSSLEFKMNVLYTFAQGMYWMIVCCCVSMGSAFLSNKGYSTFVIGILFAFAYLFAVVIQHFGSVLVDNTGRFNVLDLLAIFGFIISIDLLLATGTGQKSALVSITFLIGAMLATIIQPFLNALNFYIERYDIKMNFGIARASGSFFFFIISIIVGFFMKTVSENAAPLFGLLVSILFTITILWIYKELKATGKNVEKEYDPFNEIEDSGFDVASFTSFAAKYRTFFVFLIGVICFFFGHIVVNNFLYQIAVNVNGDEATTGGLLAIQAIVELPAMIFYSRLKEKFGSKLLLGLSGVFFLLKIFFTAIATSVGLLYFSMLFQSLGFALFIPASVHFVDEIMSKKDAVKGQAYFTIATTISSLLGSILGGIIVNLFGVGVALYFSTLVTFAGALIGIWALLRINIQK